MAPTYDSNSITRALGLPRPFDTYAPRTQQRYLAAYRAGQSREEALEAERRQRRRSPRERARRAGRALKRAGMNANGSHDSDNIDRLVDAIGGDEAADLLEDQLDAVRQYKSSRNPSAGRRHYARSQDIEIIGQNYVDIKPYSFYRA